MKTEFQRGLEIGKRTVDDKLRKEYEELSKAYERLVFIGGTEKNERLRNALEIIKNDTTLSFVVQQIALKALEEK